MRRQERSTTIGDVIDDATRSRLANVKRAADPAAAKKNLYAVFDKQQTMCLVVVAQCAETAMDYCQRAGMRSWNLRDCVCRSIVRNIHDDENGLVTAVKLKNNDQ